MKKIIIMLFHNVVVLFEFKRYFTNIRNKTDPVEIYDIWVHIGCVLVSKYAPFSTYAIMISWCYADISNGGFDRIHERLLEAL
jgi:hypothetical protein